MRRAAAPRPGGARAGDAFRANTRAATRGGEAGHRRLHVAGRRSAASAPAISDAVAGASVRRSDRTTARSATSAPTRRRRHGRNSRKSRCRIRSCRRPASASGAPRRGPENSAPQAPGVRGFRDIAADADDLGRAAAQANRAARKTYANVPSPSPEFDRLEPTMENRGADAEAPYSYDESVEEAERYAPPQQRRARGWAGPRTEKSRPRRRGVSVQERDRDRRGADPGGAAILWGKSALTTVSGLFKPSTTVVEAPKDSAAVEAEDSRSRWPAALFRTGRPGGAARRAV